MARIAGIDLPKNKRGVIGLTYIYGVGSSTATAILAKAGVSEDKKVELDDCARAAGYLLIYAEALMIGFGSDHQIGHRNQAGTSYFDRINMRCHRYFHSSLSYSA